MSIEEISEPMEQGTGADAITDMEILAKLLEKRNIELHTTIHNPLAMTMLDWGLKLIRAEFGPEMERFCATMPGMYRVNMVAENGDRAKGIMNAVAAKKEEIAKKTAMDKALGDLNR